MTGPVPSSEVLAGLVERVTFHNAENGFCVLRVKARGHRELITVVGHAATISAGEWITASGEWVNDRTHGQQFKAHFLRCSAPTSADGIEKYLGLRHDPRHRPGLRQEAGQGLRRAGLRRHRGRARAAAPGRRHRPDPCGADHRRLGRAEGGPRDHGLPAQPWRRHGAGGADLQDLRHRCRPGDEREPVSPRPRHPRHRLQDRRCDRHAARHREDGDDPGTRGHRLCLERGHGRGALRPADRGAGAARRGAARGRGRHRPDRPRAGARRRCGDRRHGGRDTVYLPRRAASGRAGDRRAHLAAGRRQAAVAGYRSGPGAAVDRGQDRPRLGAEPGRGDPAGAHLEGPCRHRRSRGRQDHDRQQHPADPCRQGHAVAALRADWPRRQANDGSHRLRGQDHPPAARGRSQDRRLQAQPGEAARLRPPGGRRDLDGRRPLDALAARGRAGPRRPPDRRRHRPAAVGRPGPGPGRHHRLGISAGRASHRGLPPGGTEPDHHQRAPDQPGLHARPREARWTQRLLLRPGRRSRDRGAAHRRAGEVTHPRGASASIRSATSRCSAR